MKIKFNPTWSSFLGENVGELSHGKSEICKGCAGVSTVFTRVHGGISVCFYHVWRRLVLNNWILKGMGHPKSSPKSLGEYKTDILTSSKIRLSSDLVSIQK